MRLLTAMITAATIGCGMVRAEVSGAIDTGKRLDVGFDQDSKVLSVGLLQGGSPFGVDFEYGLSYVVGAQAGIGLGGADVGLNFHIVSDMYKDFYFSAQAVYWPLFDHLVMPSVTFATRWYMGAEKRAGFMLEFGTAVALRSAVAVVNEREVEISRNRLFPRIGLAAAFKLR